ncbi:MAG: hypothetical protein NC314_06725 [Roseburia sp.]|nr:hypothetical protein [Ruminococcus sp.]MCM1156129.1 hypothetical protein [Roseburia sp.]MCM1242520.1 hypothetical protein [Roseburia sp.]
MKKLSMVLAGAMAVSVLGGCGNSFDAAEYLRAILDNSYKNDSSKFVSMKVGTEEEAKDLYEQGLKGEVDALVTLSGTTATDAQYEELKSTFVGIYEATKYTVDGAEKQDDGSYAVTITYEQINVLGPAMEAYAEEVDNMIADWDSTGEYPDTDEMAEQFMDVYIDCFADALANVTYDEAATATIKVELVDQVWTPNTTDVNNFQTSLFDIEALQAALQ